MIRTLSMLIIAAIAVEGGNFIPEVLKGIAEMLNDTVEVVKELTEVQNDAAGQQLPMYRDRTKGLGGIMTTSNGAPVDKVTATVTLNSSLIFNEYFMDSLTHLVRERIPERAMHAKGGGAFGVFKVTHDITDICKAKLFSRIGKQTPVAVRFSPVVVEKGGIDTSRDTRGFAVKFYTEDGNFDIVGTNTPVYAYKDPVLVSAFVRAQKKNPATGLPDANMLWDYLTLRPESINMFMYVFGDSGIPDGYSLLPGYGIHTFQVVNKEGQSHFVRFHLTVEKIKNLRSDEARRIAGVDPDYNNRELYNAIGNGSFPAWGVSVQVLSVDDVKNAGFDVFDVTKLLPLDKYPLRPIGVFVLNKNPVNYFEEIEQLAFCPGNLVPGIPGAPDKVFEARRLAYRDAQYHRLGANFHKIPVNCPFRAKPLAYNRDGAAPVGDNGGDSPNYYPNSFNGPAPYTDKHRVPLIQITQDEPNNFDQARYVYEELMSSEHKTRFVENVVYSLSGTAKFLQDRAVKLFTLVHPDLGHRISEALTELSKSHNKY